MKVAAGNRCTLVPTMAIVFLAAAGLGGDERAENAAYLSALENAIVEEVNLARTDPKQYATYVEEVRRSYDGRQLIRPGEVPLVTEEGPGAAAEAVRFLRKQARLSRLAPARGLSLAARNHVKEQGPTGATGHNGTNGSQPWDRIDKYGSWAIKTAENIAYGHSTARDIVIALIIDDGVRNRGHRKTIFDPSFRVIGVATGPHARYHTMCVMTFAGGFVDKRGN